MPTFKKRKSNKGLFSQSVVQAAVNEVTCNKVSIRSAAKKYNLDRSTLQRYVKRSGGKAASVRKCSMVTRQIFSVDEENALKQYITTSSKLFYGLTKQKARKLAFEYAQFKEKDIPSSWQNNKMAGEDWLKGFRRRQGSISLRSPESTSLARAMAFNQHNVSEFFVKLKELYTRNNVPAQRVWNLDETGVNTVQNGGKVLCETGSKQVGQIKSGERGVNVTMCCCINALGHCLPPAYIFPRVNFKSHMLKGAPSGSLGLANSSGWMKDTLFPTVLQHFISHMNVSCANPGILTMDNHSSHLSIECIELARKSGLSILTFPPHCSHRLQPLDVCVFGPFKRFYGSFCDAWHCAHPGSPITIYDVVEISANAVLKAFTPENITSAFRSTGIFPFNSEVFSEDAFLPSTVTDHDHRDDMDATNGNVATLCSYSLDESLTSNGDLTAAAGTSTSNIEILRILSPHPKSTRKPKSNRLRKKSAVITDTPEKNRIVALKNKTVKQPLFVVESNSDTSIDDTYSLAESECTDDEEESTSNEIIESLNPKEGNFVVAKVYTSAHYFKCFVGKINSGPDKDGDYEVKFLRRSKKLKNGFVYPDIEDIASVHFKDIVKILPSPQPTCNSSTKRLSSVLRFAANLTSV